ncbi:MAG: hypothetical protein AAFZ17_01665 [Cyanobacteria bacterium J06650_10]
MSTSTATSATALTLSPTSPSTETASESSAAKVSSLSANLPHNHSHHPEYIRHLLFGTPAIVQATIRSLHHLGYAEPNDWSRPISTGRANEAVAILTKRMSLG